MVKVPMEHLVQLREWSIVPDPGQAHSRGVPCLRKPRLCWANPRFSSFDSLIEAEFGRGVAAEIISLLERWARLLVEGRVDQGKAAVSGPT